MFFAFCIVSMTGSILHFLLEFRKELAVHRMVGADEKSVILRTLMPLWTAYAAAAVILVAVCGFGAESVCLYYHGVLHDSFVFCTGPDVEKNHDLPDAYGSL